MLSLKAKLVSAIVVGFFAAGAQAGIVGSKHDFSSYGWSKNQICLPCHAPHAAGGENQTYKAGILWNHTLTTKTKGIKFDIYSSSNSNPTGGTTDLDPNSILCMSCHDGTVALDSFGGATGTQMITGSLKGANGDLTGNHPVGTDAAYPTDATGKLSTRTSMADPQDLSKGGYRVSLAKVDVTTTTNGVTTTTSKYLVGCGTCHNPHNSLGQAAGEGMLRVPQNKVVTVGGTSALSNGAAATLRPAGTTYSVPGSGLCLTCHIK